jgi:CBS domain-containing protein
VADIMTRDVLAVSPDTGLESAARLMTSSRISGLPVVEGDRLVGVVSLMDLVDPDRNRSATHEEDEAKAAFYKLSDGDFVAFGIEPAAADGVVADVMTPYVISVSADTDLVEAARQMTDYRVHRLLVMDGERLVGIVSSLDLLDGLVAED